MRIRTRVKIGGALTICVLLAYGALVVHLDRAMSNLAQEVKEANEIVHKITTLRTLTQDFLLYRTERSQRQWAAVYAEMLQLLHNPEYRVLLSEYGIGDPFSKLKIVGDIFSRLMTTQPPAGPNNPGEGARGELQNRLTTQLLLTTQDLLTRFLNLTGEINQKLIKTQRFIFLLDILALSLLGILLISNMVFLQRSVVKPVLKLHEGAEIIGAGNLDHKVGLATPDEIGQLSQAFDRMTANLQEITVSRDELAKEIEERKRAEEKNKHLASFPEMNPTPVLELDLSGAVTYSNQAALKSLEKLGPEAGWKDLLPEDLGEITAAVRAKKGEFFSREVRVKDTVFSQNIFFAEPFQVLRIYCLDITERQQAEEKLKLTLADLARSNQELEEFAYVASHDLQEPLRKIANFSEMLAKRYQGQLDERADKYLDYVADGAKRMKDLINDLLAFSRVGRADFRLIATDLNDILKRTLNDIQPLVREKQAKITHEPLPTLNVNPPQMGQLLQNLIANAIKFHGDQPPHIHLSARREDAQWIISVRDQGIGFDPQFAEAIFKVFRRLHTKEEYPGTGIGLAICKKIVERHGGRIWAASEPGQGTTFYFTIPA